ncbi:MAG TPA: hypothetical protein VL970_11190, partial [Candidatus Acidoferrales bacterium]|nr:hypothetical protein [Candidatus Acidoferrales bacterium]
MLLKIGSPSRLDCLAFHLTTIKVCLYVLSNPVSAALDSKPEDSNFHGAVMPGYSTFGMHFRPRALPGELFRPGPWELLPFS